MTFTRKSRLVKNFGHTCGLNTQKEIFNHQSSTNLFTRIVSSFRKTLMICELNPRTAKYCRSQYAIYMEKQYHSEVNPNIIHPLSNFRKWWEFFMIFVSMSTLILIPYTTAFSLLTNISNVYTWHDIPRIILDIFAIIDIFMNFRTGFYDDQRAINLNVKDIAKHYLKTFFIFDLLSSLPPLYLTENLNVNNLSITLFTANMTISGMKFFRLFSCLFYMNNFSHMMNVRNYNSKMFLIFLSVAVLFHWMACLCIIISTLSVRLYFNPIPLKQSWITHNNLWNSSSALVYATGLFRTSCIVSSAEYEAVDEHAVEDQLLICVLWVFARIMYTAFVSILIQITRSLTSSQSKYKEMVLQLMQYMHHKQLSSYTQSRLISYYEFRFQKSFFREQEILNTISGQLRQEILMLKCLKLVENVPFFKGLPQSLLMRIVSSLQLEIFLINDVIIKAKARGSSMYFIGSGTVALYTETGKEIYHLHDGQHFGEIELVMAESVRIASTVAIEPCELYRLDRKDFIQIIQPYPDLLSSIQEIAAERLQYILAIDKKHKYFYNERRINKKNML